jgi:protein-L-isoaspartate(D-aspartate) O-methyltransferase
MRAVPWNVWAMPILLLLLPACQSSDEPSETFQVLSQREETESSARTPATAPVETWQRPRSDEYADLRRRMVETQLAGRDITDAGVLAAMRDVPRHWFVPKEIERLAYNDRPLPIGFDQTISQPYIVALMTQLVAVQRGDRVLEIGTGSGYQAAVLNELTPHVFTIEIVEPLVRRTIKIFEQRGYDNIRVRIGDGFRGWPEAAPFDAILVTCAAPEIPPPLIEQLRTGGRLCIPVDVGPRGQDLVLMVKRDDGTLERRSVLPVIFVPMTGEAQEKGR